MKTLCAIIGLIGCITLAHAQGYVANMDGSQEVPTNNTVGNIFISGSADFTLNGATLTCTAGSFEISGNQTTVTVNDGAPGSNGPVLFSLTILTFHDPQAYTQASFDGSGTLTAQQISDLNAGDLYVNVPSSTFPDGEIRGEILSAVPEPSTMALIATSSLVFLAGIRRKGQSRPAA